MRRMEIVLRLFGEDVITVIDTPLRRYWITERQTMRFLRDGLFGLQSGIDLVNPEKPLFFSISSALAGLVFPQKVERVLQVGLGGGAFMRHVAALLPEAELFAADVDPEIPKIARLWFGCPDVKVAVEDGAAFLHHWTGKADCLFLDAFRGSVVPPHLLDMPFLRLASRHLTYDGIFIVNFFSWNRYKIRRLAKRFSEVFPYVRLLPEKRWGPTNVTFYLANRPPDFEGARRRAKEFLEQGRMHKEVEWHVQRLLV